MPSDLLVLLTTLPSEWNESQIGSFSRSLLDAGAACIEYSAITSIFRWDGSVTASKEWKIEVKLSSAFKQQVVQTLKHHHPYDVPQIVCLFGEASDAYASWASNRS